MLIQVSLTKNQTHISTLQTSLSDDFTALSARQLDEAKKNEQNYERAVHHASHENMFRKIFSYVAAALGLVLAAVTGGAAAFLVTAALSTMAMIGGKANVMQDLGSSLESALRKAGCPAYLVPVVTALVKVGVVVAATGAIAGAGGAVGAAANSGERQAGESFVAQAGRIGFSQANVAIIGSQLLIAANPGQDLIQGLLSIPAIAKHLSEATRNEIAQIGGAVTQAIIGLIGMKLAVEDSVGANGGFSRLMNPGSAAKAVNTLQLLSVGTTVASSYYGVQTGRAQYAAGEVLGENAQAQAALELFTDLSKIANQSAQTSGDALKQLTESEASQTKALSSLAMPARAFAEILG
jgi:hypothetical protein